MTAPGLRILVTGSRDWTDKRAIARALCDAIDHYGEHVLTRDEYGPKVLWDQVTVVHGAARGADTLAGRIAAAWGMCVEAHPADWDRHRKAAGPLRNKAMVSLGAHVCLAFPLGRSIGTRHCMKEANAAGIPVRSYEPVVAS